MNYTRFFFFFTVFFSVAQLASATFISPGKYIIDFEPNLEKDLGFFVGGAPEIKVELSGNLAPYAQITGTEDVVIQGMKGQGVYIHLKLPEWIDSPGLNEISVKAIEIDKQTGMIGATAAVIAPIFIVVPYPGVYIQKSLNIPDINQNETAVATVLCSNLGWDNLTDVWTEITFLGPDNSTLKTMKSETKGLKSRQRDQFFKFEWNSKGYDAGNYGAHATLHYRNNMTNMSTTFRVGKLEINLIEYTRNISYKAISPFDIKIQSGWNSRVKSVYAIVFIGNLTFQTPSLDLEPWQIVTLKGFADSAKMEPGTYDTTIELYFHNVKSTFKGQVEVLPPTKKKLLENPELIYGGIIGVLVITMILLIFVVLILMKRQKRQGSQQQNQQQVK